MIDNTTQDYRLIKKVYTPSQIAFASFVGGLAALVYFLMANFGMLGQTVNKYKTLMAGAIALFCLLFILPDLLEGAGLCI